MNYIVLQTILRVVALATLLTLPYSVGREKNNELLVLLFYKTEQEVGAARSNSTRAPGHIGGQIPPALKY